MIPFTLTFQCPHQNATRFGSIEYCAYCGETLRKVKAEEPRFWRD